MRIAVLGSGSGGNCTLVETGRTRLLIDAGFGIRSLARRCAEAGLPLGRVDGILLTHGHSDHVAAVPSLAERFDTTVYLNEGTLGETPLLAGLDRCEVFQTGVPFRVGEVTVEPFSIPHDAADPVGFRLEAGGIRGLLATDLGRIPPGLAETARNCDWLVLEANHDEELLKIGPYPWQLKRRVLGSKGHLSNRALAEFLSGPFDGSASHLFLAHLSRQNNLPELALEAARDGLCKRPSLFGKSAVRVHLTHQSKPSIVVDL